MERRIEARIETDVHLTCRIPARPSRTTLHDLSHYGCRLDLTDANVELGGTVLLDFPGAPLFPGHVVWIRGNQAGVHFERPLQGAPAVALGLDQPEPEPEPYQLPEPARDERGGLLKHWIRRLTGRG